MAGVFLSAAISGWINHPSEVTIETFSLPATSLPFPAISVCKTHKYDPGEYLRTVFDSFAHGSPLRRSGRLAK